MSLRQAVEKYLAALDALSEINDANMDDSGKRDTPGFKKWLEADCFYTKTLTNLREAIAKLSAEAGNEILKPAPDMAAEKKAAIAAFEAKVAEVRHQSQGEAAIEAIIGMTINAALLLPAPRLEAAVDMLNLWLKA